MEEKTFAIMIIISGILVAVMLDFIIRYNKQTKKLMKEINGGEK